MKAVDVTKKRYCPCCGCELDNKRLKKGMYKCPICGLEGTWKQTIRTPKPKVWRGEYDEYYLNKMGYDIMTGPEANDLVGHRGFRSNAWLITDEEGMMLYGSYAYVYKKNWWDKIVEKEQEKEDEEED